MPDMPKNLIPARYVGNHAVELGPGMAYYNIDGTRRRSNTLEVNDTLMMRDEDILGKTLLNNANDGSQLYLGIGHNVLPEHAGKSRQELAQIGYEWHMGRPDFEPLEVPSEVTPVKEEVPSSMVIDDSQATITETPETVPFVDAEVAESENN